MYNLSHLVGLKRKKWNLLLYIAIRENLESSRPERHENRRPFWKENVANKQYNALDLRLNQRFRPCQEILGRCQECV